MCRMQGGSAVGSAPWQSPAGVSRSGASWGPWGLPSLSCEPLRSRISAWGLVRTEQTYKKAGGRMASPDCNFLMLQKLDCTPEILVLGVFLPKKVIYAPLVRMRSPVQIWSAAPQKLAFSAEKANFFFDSCTFSCS